MELVIYPRLRFQWQHSWYLPDPFWPKFAFFVSAPGGQSAC